MIKVLISCDQKVKTSKLLFHFLPATCLLSRLMSASDPYVAGADKTDKLMLTESGRSYATLIYHK